MRKNSKIMILSVSIFLISVCVLSSSNLSYLFAGIFYGGHVNSGEIIFSRESGFYDEGFYLRLYAPAGEIYYTLDGSDPDRNSIKYEKPVFIGDASENQNTYSMRTDVTASFLNEKIEKYSANPEEYKIPDYNIDKCNVIKAVYYDKTGEPCSPEERVYFVGYHEKNGYEDMNVISIVTDPDNLFAYDSGIYVTGETFDTWFEANKDEDSWELSHWSFWGANYRNRGKDWERESSIQVFNRQKELVLSQKAGIRIQGGGSRALLPKSLNIYAREEYGFPKLYYDFFDTGFYPQRVTLSIGGGDQYTKIKDRLISELSKECNIVTMNYEPYILFLNGEYWGVYHLTEKYDEDFISYYYDVDKGELIDDIIMIKNGSVETGVEADYYVSYSEMVEFVTTADMTKQENYERACELLDIESFIDYFAVEGYIARCGDWPGSNFALWRTRNVSGKPYEDGKWRWMLFDVNSTAMERDIVSLDAIASMRAESNLFDNLCNNESFRRSFSKRFLEIADTVFEKEHVSRKLTEYTRELERPMENHFKRFFGTSNEKFYENIEELRFFFDNRRPYIIDSIKNNFGEEYLVPTVEEN